MTHGTADIDAGASDAEVTVFLVARIRLYREALAAALAPEPFIRVVGASGDLESAGPAIAQVRPDAVVVELEGGDCGWRERGHVARLAEFKPLALPFPHADPDQGTAVAYARAGVVAFLTANCSLDGLIATIGSVARNELLPASRCAPSSRHDDAAADGRRLSAREAEILELVREGLSNKEIAARLQLELTTVKNHVHRILGALRARNRLEAVEKAVLRGWLAATPGEARQTACARSPSA